MTDPIRSGSVNAHDRSERDCSTAYYVGPCAHSQRPLQRPIRISRISRISQQGAGPQKRGHEDPPPQARTSRTSPLSAKRRLRRPVLTARNPFNSAVPREHWTRGSGHRGFAREISRGCGGHVDAQIAAGKAAFSPARGAA